MALKGRHFHVMIGFYFHFPLSSRKWRPSMFHLYPASYYLLPSFEPFNLNCPSRKRYFHFKDFMSTLQVAAIFFVHFKAFQCFEIQDTVEGKIMSYFENFLLLLFQYIFCKTCWPRNFQWRLPKLSWADLIQRTGYKMLRAVH